MAPDTSTAQLINQLKAEIANLYKTSIDPQAYYKEADKLQSLGYTTWAKELRDYGDKLRAGILASGEGKGYWA